MKFTPDTNIFIHGFTEDANCRNALKQFMLSSEYFFTKKVQIELAEKRGEWTLFLKMLQKKWDGKCQLTAVYNEIKEFFGDSDDDLLNCENIVNFLENRHQTMPDFNLENEVTRFESYIGGYLASRKNIYPTKDIFDRFQHEYVDIKKKINHFHLVEGEQDKKIIQEIYIIGLYFSEDITFLTKNRKDFKNETNEWKSHISRVLVKSP